MKDNSPVHLRKTKTVAFATEAIMPSVRNDYLLGFAQYMQGRRDIALRCIEMYDIGKRAHNGKELPNRLKEQKRLA